MALTQSSLQKRVVPGNKYDFWTIVLCDAAYPNTGATIGYPITAAIIGATVEVNSCEPADPCDLGAAGYIPFIDPVTGNLRVMVSSTGAEVANGASLAGVKFRLHSRGA